MKTFSSFIVFYEIVLSGAVVMNSYLTSPCPDTFQYQKDAQGELYGTIGVYSLDENVVQLNVELSVGNQVGNYNGEIVLMPSRRQVVNALTYGRPIMYKVFFPRWERIPPRVTKILVNNQQVCSGPPIPSGDLVNVLTLVNLQHRLSRTNLQANPTNDNQNTKRIGNNPFFNIYEDNIDEKPATIPKDFDIRFNPQVPTIKDPGAVYSKNPFFNPNNNNQRPTGNNFNTFVTLGTSTTTTERPKFLPPPREITVPRTPTFNKPTTTGSTSQVYANVCGRRSVFNPLVVKGHSVPKGSFPWLVAIFHTNTNGVGLEYKCSGSLVSHKHVITAAHCVKDERKRLRPDDILTILGKLNIKAWPIQDDEKMVAAERIHVHPDYKPRKSDADIAVIVLGRDVTFTDLIRPICLWAESDDLERVVGQSGTVVGWGREEDDSAMTGEPKQTHVPIVTQEACLRSSETFQDVISDRTFCAGRRDGTGPCNGDSGSGFVMNRNGRWALFGVVSTSVYDSNRQTCDLTNYVVFTSVGKHLQWILSYTNDKT